MTDPLASTGALLRAIQTGDPSAAQELFDRYVPRVRQMVALALHLPVRRLPDDADDVVQDTLMKALQALPNFEHRGPGAFHAWIATIAENQLRNAARERRTAKGQAIWRRCADLDLRETIFPADVPTPSADAQNNELGARIEAAILSLPGLYRRAIELRDIAGMDHAEMAKELGRSEVNCRKIYQRAREMLHERLARRPPG